MLSNTNTDINRYFAVGNLTFFCALERAQNILLLWFFKLLAHRRRDANNWEKGDYSRYLLYTPTYVLLDKEGRFEDYIKRVLISNSAPIDSCFGFALPGPPSSAARPTLFLTKSVWQQEKRVNSGRVYSLQSSSTSVPYVPVKSIEFSAFHPKLWADRYLGTAAVRYMQGFSNAHETLTQSETVP